MLASIAEKIHNPLSTSITVRLIIFSAMTATVIFLRKNKKSILIVFIFLLSSNQISIKSVK